MLTNRIAGANTRTLKAICIVLVSLLFSTVSNAKSSDINPERQAEANELPQMISGIPLADFLNSSSYLRVLRFQAMKHERTYGPCNTPQFIRRVQTGQPQILRSIPEYGPAPQWIEVVEIGGCNKAHQLHMLIALVNDAPRFFPILPGNGLSLLDFTISADVMKTLVNFEKEHAEAAGCNSKAAIRIHNIRLLSYKKKDKGMSWDEAWDVSNCKAHKVLTVNFTSDPVEGTNFTINQPEPKESEITVSKSYQPDTKRVAQ